MDETAAAEQGAAPAGPPPVPAPRRARRRRVPGGRPHLHGVRLTAEEHAVVQAAADAAGMTVPNLIAETTLAALTGPAGPQMPITARRALAGELTRVRAYLAAIGRNVNQLAAAAHSGRAPADTAVTATMHAITARLAALDEALALLRGERRP